MTLKQLEHQRNKAIEKLLELAKAMLIGSASETYRTCGTPTCRCHSTGPKHGPNVYVSYRGESGKSTGYYVPKSLHEEVFGALAAWKQFQHIAKEVAQLNEQILKAKKLAQRKGGR